MKCPIEPLGDRVVLLPVDMYPTVMIRVNEDIKATIKGYNQPKLLTEIKKY